MDKEILQKIIIKESKIKYLGEKYSEDMLELYDFVEKNEKSVEYIIDCIKEYYEII